MAQSPQKNGSTAKVPAAKDKAKDLRAMLLQLYLLNNPRLEHKVFIYSFNGVTDGSTNPFHFIGGDLPANVKKSLILQNLASGEMIQAFVLPYVEQGKTQFQIENSVLYGNRSGTLIEISLAADKIGGSEKYRQFSALAASMLRQFVI